MTTMTKKEFTQINSWLAKLEEADSEEKIEMLMELFPVDKIKLVMQANNMEIPAKYK